MGETNMILDFKFIRSGNGIILSQECYIEKLLRKFKDFDATLVTIPYDANTQLEKNRGDLVV